MVLSVLRPRCGPRVNAVLNIVIPLYEVERDNPALLFIEKVASLFLALTRPAGHLAPLSERVLVGPSLFPVTPETAGRWHFSRRRLPSMTDFGSPPPPAGYALGRGSHPKIL